MTHEQTTPGQQFLDNLATDARRLRAAMHLSEHELTSDELLRAIDHIRRYLEQHNLHTNKGRENIARTLGHGFSKGTTYKLLKIDTADKIAGYQGDLEKAVRGLNGYIEQHARQKQAVGPSGYVETRVAKNIKAIIGSTIELRSMGVITGPSGVGKTLALQAAQALYTGSILIRVDSSMRNPNNLLRKILKELRIHTSNRQMFDMLQLIYDALRNTDKLVMLDEAQQLSKETLEIIRSVHDETKIPIVFMGTIDCRKHLDDMDEFFGQFNRRIAFRYNIGDDAGGRNGKKQKPLFTIDDIVKVFNQGKVRLTEDGAQRLTYLSNILGMGALGWCQQIVFSAHKQTNGKPISAADIDYVISLMGDEESRKHLAAAEQRSSVKTA